VQWGVVVPVKRLPSAKTRLSGVPDADRADLALAFALDTVTAALACPDVVEVLVVTDDERAAAALAEAGASIEADVPDSGLNPALAHGAEILAARHRYAGVAALSSDLPALRTAELARVLAAATEPVTLVSDRSGIGTTTLLARDPADFVPMFGARSRAAHRHAGAVEPDLGASIVSVRSDVDTDVDLREAIRLGVGRATAAVLARLAPSP
jgi:2-phospho-L-lactate guanylyltransferase